MHTLHIDGVAFRSTNWDEVYSLYLSLILAKGDVWEGRNGETKALFGCSVTADLSCGFPLTRLRKMPIKNLFREFLFDIGFSQNVEALGKAKHFWDFLADENGELGASAYNRQWRKWPRSAYNIERPNEKLESDIDVDQLRYAINELRSNRNSRRTTVITHNPTAIRPACPPCHLGLQFMPRPDGHLDVMVPARSNDMVVGFPLDIARYAIMLSVVADQTSFFPGKVYMPSSNSHIYENCYNAAEAMCRRDERPECHLVTKQFIDIDKLTLEDFDINGYEPHDAIKLSVN